MLTVACVLRSGGDYSPEYVARLKEGVDKHLSGHEFVCLSDIPVPCERIPLETDWPGWWSKLEVFRLTGKVLYLDLDTVITGDLTEIAEHPHRFTMLQAFIFNDGRKGSGVMAWDGDYSHLYKRFEMWMADGYRKQPRYGDQGYIQDNVELINTFQELFPGQIVSHKVDRNRSEARIVCYHGKPRPHETGWAP